MLLQPFPCREITIIDLFLVALLSLVCLLLTDSSSLVTRLTEECHRSDGEQSLEWQTPAVTYPFGSLHDLCVAVVGVLLDEVVHHFRQDLSILLIICHSLPESTKNLLSIKVSILAMVCSAFPGCQHENITPTCNGGDPTCSSPSSPWQHPPPCFPCPLPPQPSP